MNDILVFIAILSQTIWSRGSCDLLTITQVTVIQPATLKPPLIKQLQILLWNVTTLIWWGSNFSVFEALYCFCLVLNALLVRHSYEGLQ